jgi:hypothetical protein
MEKFFYTRYPCYGFFNYFVHNFEKRKAFPEYLKPYTNRTK